MAQQNASPQDQQAPDGQQPRGAQALQPPAINLPKGGGAVRGMGEKFAANPVTGTGSMSVPIATSPGRSGFGPELSLSYDSGAGNGPFGFGWNLSMPSITRKTDKGLPQYLDGGENQPDSDVFILSGAEDLVPEFKRGAAGNWLIEGDKHVIFDEPRTVDGVSYLVRRYRPRIEGLFARIERWTSIDNPYDVHWRSISKDNILTLYGKDANSRLADPEHPERIFSWLICETRDDKGNAVLYEYKPEDGLGVDLAQAHERNRGSRDDLRRSANRYLKHIRYGNRQPMLDDAGHRSTFLTDKQVEEAGWMFTVVFDYDEHDPDTPTPDDSGQWTYREDPFSTYHAGFEVRTTRLCQRVLMFHHFPDEAGVGSDCLVRSTDFTYSHEQDPEHARNPVYTFLLSVTQSGYKRENGGYLKRSLPPLEFAYSQSVVQDKVEEVAAASLENLPIGLDGAAYQWTDLHGEGIPGILTEQGGGWFYKRNLSPINDKRHNGTPHIEANFAPVEQVAIKPNLFLASGAQFMDLAGDGQPDLVVMDGPIPGLYEHDGKEGWQPFRPFTNRLNRGMNDPNLKFVDLDGDGHADVLITEDNAFVWHPSLSEAGFGPAYRVGQTLDEERGPRLIFADGTQSIYLADLSGDGLTDLARIRNGEVCYWPNLGYARFGAKVTMDHAPHFDNPDQFDQKRLRLADIDGSGTTDIIYLHRDGVRLYFNQSGNSWSEPRPLPIFPRVDDLASIMPVDLLGNGTACLVWSSPLPGDAQRPMRYVNLMSDQKPHLLVKTSNNLGAETRVHYRPSTYFYLKDKEAGKPWITRLPFPVHVVERVETHDHISRNRFVSRYAYHHGYFDGEEREFRGFGMVEQWDTEEFAALSDSGVLQGATNLDESSHVPPVHTKTWFHTGVYLDQEHISRQFEDEYYREPGLTEPEFRTLLLPDTTLPTGLTLEEEREACRALKGMMLRQEVYADDAGPQATAAEIERARTPYTVVEQDFTIRPLQPRANNRHAVFFTHPREAITYHYERNPADPRIQHVLTLEVDNFGNVLKEAAIGYGRRFDSPDALLTLNDREKQRFIHTTYTENTFTKPIVNEVHVYRTPLPAEACTYELRKPEQDKSGNGSPDLFLFDVLLGHIQQADDGQHDIAYEDIQFDKAKQTAVNNASERAKYFRRIIEHVRTLYRRDDLTDFLPLGELEPLALPGESYKLAFTPGLLAQVYKRKRANQPDKNLLPDNAQELSDLLTGKGADQGGYVQMDDNWWIPSGKVYFDPDANVVNPGATAAQELVTARRHFFLPRKVADPFGNCTTVDYDAYDLLLVRTADALNNIVTATNDYRVLQPRLVTDPNRNRTEVCFDALGMVVGTAVMGKPEESLGDSLSGFAADLTQDQLDQFMAAPRQQSANPKESEATQVVHNLLKSATTRIVYDLDRFRRLGEPAFAATIARETHVSDLRQDQESKLQISFSYSDGFGREIQKKIQAEPGPAPQRDADGKIIVDTHRQPLMTPHDVSPRWVGSGWTVFNNKGKPVRQYEPFFTDTHRFEFDVKIGVSPTLFYDPAERVVATLHPNHTWEKVVFDPWQQTTWDVNDTVASFALQTRAASVRDPASDTDVGGFFQRLPNDTYLPTWYDLRTDNAKALVEWPDQDAQGNLLPDNAKRRASEKTAADRAAAHADTPTTAHFDALGRPFLTVARNRVVCAGHALDGTEDSFATRVELDIEGNQRSVIDTLGRVVMKYGYVMAGPSEKEEGPSNLIHQASMEAGERWMFNDVAGNPIHAWDSRGFARRMTYDELRRPTGLYAAENGVERLAERTIYGEAQGEAGNHRARVYQVYDGARVVTSMAYDFKGNLLASERALLPDYIQSVDWEQNPDPNDGRFSSATTYDALNRPTELIAPDNSVIRPTYNEANLLERIEANLRGESTVTPFIADLDYDAKGQRVLAEYGNGVTTTYQYDPLTFRLTHLQTMRGTEALQDLGYTYDPAGNITHIHDDAQQTIYFRNQRVEPSADYVCDALYRLIAANGREHLGQTNGTLNAPTPHSHNDAPRVGLLHPGDGNAMGTYVERYVYDAVGNFLTIQHLGSDPAHPGWTRSYYYEEDSLIESGHKKSNRLTRTTIGNNANHSETYTYADAQGNDVHGCMTSINSMQMSWDFKDQLQRANLAGGRTAYYVYDATGQRVRKVIHRQNGTREKERIYLGGFEIYREYGGSNGDDPELERETLHIMDEQQRIALVETRTQGSDQGPPQLIRYQFGNHLGSTSLELGCQAQIISYEEYTPYGCTSYQAVSGVVAVNIKRYRFSGMERDEETGIEYHNARYYVSWLGIWLSTDPAGLEDGKNLYRFVGNNPIRTIDRNGMNGCDPQTQSCMSLSWEEVVEVRCAETCLFESTPLERAGQQSIPSEDDIGIHLLWELPNDPAKSSRRDCIISGGGCLFSIRNNPNADSSAPWYEWRNRSLVDRYASEIELVAREYSVDINLIRSIMFMETPHGSYALLFSWASLDKSILPMNINTHYWGEELFGKREELRDPLNNIRAGASMLSRIQANLPSDAPISHIATLYNNLNATTVSDYGARVEQIYKNKEWVTESSMVEQIEQAGGGFLRDLARYIFWSPAFL